MISGQVKLWETLWECLYTKAKWSETKERNDISWYFKYLPAPQHGQCVCPSFFPYFHLAGASHLSLPNCWRVGALQGPHLSWEQLSTSGHFSLPCALLSQATKLSLGFGEEKTCTKYFFLLEDTRKKKVIISGFTAGWIPLPFPSSLTLFFLNLIIKRSKNNAVMPEVQYCHNRSCSQMIKEEAL